MKITVECDNIAQLRAQLEAALLPKDTEMLLGYITERISDQQREREVMLESSRQCTEAIRVMTERIPKAYRAMREVCDKTEELLDLLDSPPGSELTLKELQIIRNDIRVLLSIMKEEE